MTNSLPKLRSKFSIVAVLVFTGTVAMVSFALQGGDVTPSKAEKPKAIARITAYIDKQTIKTDLLEALLRQQGQETSIDEMNSVTLNNMVDKLIDIWLLSQAAEAGGLDEETDLQNDIALRRIILMANAQLDQYMEHVPVTEAQLQKAYDQQIQSMKATEYKARHILLKSKEDAEKVISELKEDSSNFSQTAEQYSTGPSAKSGGDLGWFGLDRMVPEFSKAVSEMEVGHYSEHPVKTAYGWHVILLEDQREMKPPAFETMRPQLLNQIQQRQVNEYIQSLRDLKDIRVITPESSS